MSCACPPRGHSPDCPVHGLKTEIDKAERFARSPLKPQSHKQALREQYLAGVKAGFLYILRKLDPDGPTCEECGVRGNSKTLDLDHIVARSKATDDRPDNLRLLCNHLHPSGHDCHGHRHGVPEWSTS
jgi:5-methylcytosine-specific restriction endonuclease McrA